MSKSEQGKTILMAIAVFVIGLVVISFLHGGMGISLPVAFVLMLVLAPLLYYGLLLFLAVVAVAVFAVIELASGRH